LCNTQLTTSNKVYKVSEKAVELVRLAERGDRIKQVREAAEMSGDEFADAINDAAGKRGYLADFDKSTVSRFEGGKATFLPAEVAVVIAKLDPEKRGIDWLVFGDKRLPGRLPKPADPAPSSRDVRERKVK